MHLTTIVFVMMIILIYMQIYKIHTLERTQIIIFYTDEGKERYWVRKTGTMLSGFTCRCRRPIDSNNTPLSIDVLSAEVTLAQIFIQRKQK